MDQTARKDAIRRLVLARRGRLDPADRAARATRLTELLTSVPEFSAAGSVLAFVSVASEVPTQPLLESILRGDRRLLLPYVAADGMLRAAEVRGLDELEPGYRQIPEPRQRIPVDVSAANAIILPGVAFDEHGGRLGYGGGFYDRLLSGVDGVPRIGICFELQLVPEVPLDPHDQRVDIVVTEERVVRCSPGS